MQDFFNGSIFLRTVASTTLERNEMLTTAVPKWNNYDQLSNGLTAKDTSPTSITGRLIALERRTEIQWLNFIECESVLLLFPKNSYAHFDRDRHIVREHGRYWHWFVSLFHAVFFPNVGFMILGYRKWLNSRDITAKTAEQKIIELKLFFGFAVVLS